MAYNFLRGNRDQPYLLPPDLRDWLPADHLAWFVLDVVDQLDLEPFLRGYRADGHGHPAYDPKLLLGVLLYAYAIGVRSSRQIERRCCEDLAFRVLAGSQLPDHVTIARFRVRHQQALAGFLVASLRLCAAAGLVRLGVIALDGTKVAANAASRANRTLAKLEGEVAQMLREAAETDQAEDRQHGLILGDELPAELASPSGRLARLQRLEHGLGALRDRLRPTGLRLRRAGWNSYALTPAPAALSSREHQRLHGAAGARQPLAPEAAAVLYEVTLGFRPASWHHALLAAEPAALRQLRQRSLVRLVGRDRLEPTEAVLYSLDLSPNPGEERS